MHFLNIIVLGLFTYIYLTMDGPQAYQAESSTTSTVEAPAGMTDADRNAALWAEIGG